MNNFNIPIFLMSFLFSVISFNSVVEAGVEAHALLDENGSIIPIGDSSDLDFNKNNIKKIFTSDILLEELACPRLSKKKINIEFSPSISNSEILVISYNHFGSKEDRINCFIK